MTIAARPSPLQDLQSLMPALCTSIRDNTATCAALASQSARLSGLVDMRLFVLGATGRTGTEIIDLARTRGHEVTAFVRSPQKLRPAASLTIVRGDPLREEAIAAALPGHDAVLSAIGPPPKDAFRPNTLVTGCARALVDAMTASGVGRLVIVSAAVLFPEKGLYFAFFRWFLRHHARDLRGMEEIVRASSLAWTIARPPRLKQSPEAGFRALRDALPPGSRSMSYRSVAAFMLDAVEQRSHVNEIAGLAQGTGMGS
jgi:putative NADH-flavin reductase